ncbi:MAG: hypothetical protein O2954_17510 [bacterium]|nr:hypothetical protein [bacterium]
MSAPERTGIYLTTDVILNNPDYVKALQDGLGLNLVVLSFSGELPQDVLSASPYDSTPLSDKCLHDLVAKHLDGTPVDPLEFDQVRQSPGPSVGQTGSNEKFRRAIQLLHNAGVDIWICGGSWTLRRLMFCPSNEATNTWYETLYTHWATQYGAQGLDITHARYPMGSFPRGLFSCTCERCEQAAAELGYDMAVLKEALQNGLKRLQSIDIGLLTAACKHGMGPFDFLQILNLDTGILDWFKLRAAILERNLARFRQAVHNAAPGVLFGADTYPASLSMFMGHNHARWSECADFASPLVSHIYQFVSLTLIEWAKFLQQTKPGLSETDALQIVYTLTGYAGVGLPETIAGYRSEDPDALAHSLPLEDVILHDLIKARLSLPSNVPSYPILHGEGWPKDAIPTIRDRALEIGHNGIIWQGTSELVPFNLK